MPAAQVTTGGGELIAADPDQHREAVIQNLGPNAIYLAVGAAAAVATGLRVAASTGERVLRVPAGLAVNAIAETANQSSPADTRYLIA